MAGQPLATPLAQGNGIEALIAERFDRQELRCVSLGQASHCGHIEARTASAANTTRMG